jgi:polyisoprenoid-binding protein YceI
MKYSRSILVLLATLLLGAVGLHAQEEIVDIDIAQSRVTFTLDDILHTVHGSFQLKSGSLRFDRTTGTAVGHFVVDAKSGDSGSKARDRKMNKDVLESDRYPEIVFAVEHVSGTPPGVGSSTLEVQGDFILHGQSHPLTLSVPVQVDGGVAAAEIRFQVPYVKWGLKNPSTLFLRVGQEVAINIHVVGRLKDSPTASSVH